MHGHLPKFRNQVPLDFSGAVKCLSQAVGNMHASSIRLGMVVFTWGHSSEIGDVAQKGNRGDRDMKQRPALHCAIFKCPFLRMEG